MKMIYALVQGTIVVNTIVVSDPEFLKSLVGFTAIVRIDDLDPVPGMLWQYIGGVFSPPLPPDPPESPE